jgi:hypothetical protein
MVTGDESFRAEKAKDGLIVQRLKGDRVIAETLCENEAQLRRFVESFK